MSKKDIFYYSDSTTSSRFDRNKILHRIDGPAIEWNYRTNKWYIDDKLHRIDGPAIECINGDKIWYIDDKLHRVDGPAVEFTSGHREWYINDKLHRIDGPAVEFGNGNKYWYIDDVEYAEQKFNQLIKEVNQLPTTLKLIDPRGWVRELGKKEVG